MWVAQGDVFKSLQRYNDAARCYERAFAIAGDPALLRELALLYKDKIVPPNLEKVLTNIVNEEERKKNKCSREAEHSDISFVCIN